MNLSILHKNQSNFYTVCVNRQILADMLIDENKGNYRLQLSSGVAFVPRLDKPSQSDRTSHIIYQTCTKVQL